MMTNLLIKYSPKKIDEIVGQKLAISKIINFLESHKKKKGLFIFGQPGVGKTASIRVIIKEMDYEVIQLTADDLRDTEKMDSLISNSINTASIFGKKRLVLIDGIDSLNSRSIAKVAELIRKSGVPVVVIGLDFWNQKFKFLRPYCEKVEFRKLTYKEIMAKLISILNSEGIEYDYSAVELLAKSSDGDLRAAINDLEASIAIDNKLTKDNVFLCDRNIKKNVFSAMQKIFKSPFSMDVLIVFDVADIDLNTGILWVSENICNEYTNPITIAGAYENVSRSDVFLGRIRRRQYYGFYKYAKILSTAGININAPVKSKRFVRYAFPSRLLKLSQSKNLRSSMKSTSRKIAPKFHVSSSVFLKDYVPLLKILIKTKKVKKKHIKEEFGLTDGELTLLAK